MLGGRLEIGQPWGAASDHRRWQPESVSEHALLSNGLADNGVRATKAIAKHDPFGACHQGVRGHAVRVVGDREDECTCVAPAPLADETRFVGRSPLIVDVSVGPVHGIPQSHEPWMEEAEPREAAIGLVTFEDADPAEDLSIGLPVIEDHEANAVSPANQLLAE
jgi:hypothetical protein